MSIEESREGMRLTFHHFLPLDDLLNLAEGYTAHGAGLQPQASTCQGPLDESGEGASACQGGL